MEGEFDNMLVAALHLVELYTGRRDTTWGPVVDVMVTTNMVIAIRE